MITKGRYTKTVATALLLAGAAYMPAPADACTRAVYLGPDSMVVTGRTMDWKEDPQIGRAHV